MTVSIDQTWPCDGCGASEVIEGRGHKRNPEFQSGDSRPRKTTRKQPQPDPLHGVIRNGACVRL